MPGGPKITLYVDIVSPFSYLAYYMLRVSSLRVLDYLSHIVRCGFTISLGSLSVLPSSCILAFCVPGLPSVPSVPGIFWCEPQPFDFAKKYFTRLLLRKTLNFLPSLLIAHVYVSLTPLRVSSFTLRKLTKTYENDLLTSFLPLLALPHLRLRPDNLHAHTPRRSDENV